MPYGVDICQLLVDEVFSNLTGAYVFPRWAANDHLGTVGQLLDVPYGIVEHREYDAFGAIDEVFTSAGNSVPPPFRKSDVGHAGQLWDDDAELYQNRARWYDPNTGRFLGEDPAQDGSNWYAYAGNDPINFRDPTGLSQVGNPLNSLAGGFSSGIVLPAPDPLDFTPIQLFGASAFNDLVSPTATRRPARNGNAFAGIGSSLATIATTVARNTNPIASSVVTTGLGVARASLFAEPIKSRRGLINVDDLMKPARDDPFADVQFRAGMSPRTISAENLRALVPTVSELQVGLDAAGLIEGPLGTLADLTNAGISAARGNFGQAAFSLGAALPVLGGVIVAARKAGAATDLARAADRLENLAPDELRFLQVQDVKVGRNLNAAPSINAVTPRNARLAGKRHPVTGVPFSRQGFPDFSSISKKDVKITQTGKRNVDEAAANQAAGISSTPKGFTWHHHQDGRTMQLVPRRIHEQTGHTGGTAIVRQRDQ